MKELYLKVLQCTVTDVQGPKSLSYRVDNVFVTDKIEEAFNLGTKDYAEKTLVQIAGILKKNHPQYAWMIASKETVCLIVGIPIN